MLQPLLNLLNLLYNNPHPRNYILSESLEILVDCMHGVMGVTAKRVFCEELGVKDTDDHLIRSVFIFSPFFPSYVQLVSYHKYF